MRVLAVDDDPLICLLYEMLLTGKGHEVLCVDNGKACLAVIDEWRPSVVLLDGEMPECNGIDVLEAMAARHLDVPVVFASAHTSSDDKLRALRAGAHEYLTKPFDPDQTLGVVDRLVHMSSAQRAEYREFAIHELDPDARMPERELPAIASDVTHLEIVGDRGTEDERTDNVHSIDLFDDKLPEGSGIESTLNDGGDGFGGGIDHHGQAAAQHAAIAHFTHAAMSGASVDELTTLVVRNINGLFDVVRCAIVQTDGDGPGIVLACLGVSCGEMTVRGRAIERVMTDLQQSGEGVAVIEASPELRKHHAGLGDLKEMWVLIGGVREPFGAIVVGYRDRRPLRASEVWFLRAQAGILAEAIRRQRSDDRMRAYLEGAPDATIIVDQDGMILYANKEVEHLFGYSRSDVTGMPVETLIPERFRLAHAEHWNAFGSSAHSRGMGGKVDLYGLRKDQSEVPVDIMLRPLHTDQGDTVVVAIRDASERHRLDCMREAFLHAVSHELRTPLAAVSGFSSILMDERNLKEAPPEVQQLATNIHTAAQRLQKLLTDLLDVDRLSRGVVSPRRAHLDISRLLSDVIAGAQLGDMHIVPDFDRSARVINADRAQIERIIENLLVNCKRHCPSGTAVYVRSERRERDIVIVVEDGGPGVPEGMHKTLFEPFERGHQSSRAPGTGIGLSLVARFAELHGGHAWVEDRPGGGSRFCVLLADAVTDGEIDLTATRATA